MHAEPEQILFALGVRGMKKKKKGGGRGSRECALKQGWFFMGDHSLSHNPSRGTRPALRAGVIENLDRAWELFLSKVCCIFLSLLICLDQNLVHVIHSRGGNSGPPAVIPNYSSSYGV